MKRICPGVEKVNRGLTQSAYIFWAYFFVLFFGRASLRPYRDRCRGGTTGGQRCLETMALEVCSERARKASLAAAKKRTAARLERERQAKRK